MIRATLLAVVALAVTAVSTTATAQSPAPWRKLASTATGGYEVAWIGNDEKVNHCALGYRGHDFTPRPGKPQFMLTAERNVVILRVWSTEWKFDAPRPIAVTLVTADGQERKPLAKVHGPHLVDIMFGTEPERMAELIASGRLEVRTEAATVRIALRGLAGAMPAFNQCMAAIGKPAKGWTDKEIEEILGRNPVCAKDKRHGVTVCEIDPKG